MMVLQKQQKAMRRLPGAESISISREEEEEQVSATGRVRGMAWASGRLMVTHKRQEAAAETRRDAGRGEGGPLLAAHDRGPRRGGRAVEVADTEEEEVLPGRKKRRSIFRKISMGKANKKAEVTPAEHPGDEYWQALPVATEPLLPADCRATLLFFSRVFPPGNARNASKRQAALRAKAASKFAKGLRCVQDRKLDLARAKFRTAVKARFLLHDNIHHLSISPVQ